MSKKWVPFNVNNRVKVKLSETGKRVFHDYHNRYERVGRPEDNNIDGKIWGHYAVGDGYYSFQMHDLMLIYGEFMYNGNSNISFETEIFFQVKDDENG